MVWGTGPGFPHQFSSEKEFISISPRVPIIPKRVSNRSATCAALEWSRTTTKSGEAVSGRNTSIADLFDQAKTISGFATRLFEN